MNMKTLALLPVIWLSLSVAVAAQQRPCAADIQRLCPGVTPGTPEGMKCLRTNADKLSPACKARIGGGRRSQQNVRQMLDACKADLEKFCKDVQPGGGRYVGCLQGHSSEISAPCKAALPTKTSPETAAKPAAPTPN